MEIVFKFPFWGVFFGIINLMIDHRKGNREGMTRKFQVDRAELGEKER